MLSRAYQIGNEEISVLVTIAANIGSALTPIGNPQNIIIWRYFHINFYKFILYMLPFSTIGTVILISISYFIFRKIEIKEGLFLTSIKLNKKLVYSSLIVLVLDVVLAQYGLELYTIILTAVVFLIIDKDILVKLDYPFILIFAFIFIDFRELSVILEKLSMIPPLHSNIEILLLSIILSQFISNIPATITLVDHVKTWEILVLGVNLAGVGFITGSIANIIKYRMTRMDLKKFHLYTIPFFLILIIIFVSLVMLHIFY